MWNFDFAVALAIGSIIASTILTKDPQLFQAFLTLGVLNAVPMTAASLRGNSTVMYKMAENEPLLPMNNKGVEILNQNLKRAKVTKDNLRETGC